MNPILINFPEEIYTDRLFIRKPIPGDGKMVFESIMASINELKPWMPWANGEQTEEEVEVNIRDAHAKFLTREDLRLHIFDRETGGFVGATGLHRMNWDVPKFEIGYWIDTRQSGKGYIMESTHAITEFAFGELNAKRVEIRCDSRNRKSRAIPEKLGFTLEVILKNDGISADRKEIRDTCIYAKIK
jgi:RimJ/RimL family protein N-acetyltransferase